MATDNWSIETGFDFGGHAKSTDELKAFIAEFEASHGVTLDWVYVASRPPALVHSDR